MFNSLNLRCLCLFVVTIALVTGQRNISHDLTQVLINLPVLTDLDYYIDALDRAVEFCLKNEKHVDINLAFGMFLVNVHLKPVFEEKRYNLPDSLQERIKIMLYQNDKVLIYYNAMVNRDQMPADRPSKLISSLFDELTWIRRLPKFNLRLTEYHPERPVYPMNVHLKAYKHHFNDMKFWKPLPGQSDTCNVELANNKISPSNAPTQCILQKLCSEFILHGSEFGYPASHRLLMLIAAKFGRGCSIFSPMKDRNLTYELCQHSYFEAEYIAKNKHVFVDLMFELIALCTVDGHVQFLQSSWLGSILRLQTRYGCFAESFTKLKSTPANYPEGSNTNWQISKTDFSVLGGACSSHVTAVSAGCLAAAVRYILETYY